MGKISRRTFLGAGGMTVAVAASGGGARAAKQRPKPEHPNILLLMADQFRGDCLGADGNTRIQTPNLDAIARDGMRFSRAYSSVPSCTPARAGLLTGMSPWGHGMIGYGRVGEKYPVEMPGALAGAGYHTFGIGKMHWHPQRNGHGFHGMMLDESSRSESVDFRSDYRAWFMNEAPCLDPDATGIGWNSYKAGPYAPPEHLHPTMWTGNTAVRYLEGYDRPEPFFLKVSFARPHSPYDPPERFWRQYADAPLPEAAKGEWSARYAPKSSDKDELWHGDLGAETVRAARRAYYGSVSFIDEQVGRIMETLERRGMLEDTLIVFTADHGDMLGDHHHWRKTYAYEGSARIPMLLRWPKGLAPENRGTVCDRPVELRDVLPTFLDAAGVEPSRPLEGSSLLALARDPQAPWREMLDLEHDTCYDSENHWSAVTDGKLKYIYHTVDGREQLFDLEADPHETTDLAGDTARAGDLERMRAGLVRILEPRGDKFVKDGRLVPRPESILYSPNYPGCSCHPDTLEKVGKFYSG